MHEWVNNNFFPEEASNSWTCVRCGTRYWGVNHKPPPDNLKITSVTFRKRDDMKTCDEIVVARIMER